MTKDQTIALIKTIEQSVIFINQTLINLRDSLSKTNLDASYITTATGSYTDAIDDIISDIPDDPEPQDDDQNPDDQNPDEET